jgi:hypothetical protein
LSLIVAGVTPILVSIDLVGLRLLLAIPPLEESYLLRPALALLDGVASRLLTQPTLRTEPAFMC